MILLQDVFERPGSPNGSTDSTMAMMPEILQFPDQFLLSARGPKNRMDPNLPYARLVEPEPTAAGILDFVARSFRQTVSGRSGA